MQNTHCAEYTGTRSSQVLCGDVNAWGVYCSCSLLGIGRSTWCSMNGTMSKVKMCRGAFCCCCAAHNFPFFFDPLSSPASRLRLILRRGGDGCSMEDWQPLSLRSAGGKQAGGKAKRRLFATSSTLSKLTPLYFHPRSSQIGAGLRDGVRISEMYG